ncbi:schlafen-like protein 1 [Rhinatrema bivittatum]|uniref:schlafen-like protein 1 n=1 Tax=Rhinatrema bivittatum TaxID=194408 RepID=UPI00112CE039|nr:schlafen-like protein 1 [Rhinatrema bivittatum]XP_029475891.1 schlafen-like protein 1 [Rhinatrema bivittatum]XP_029475892.1 schlafen-like protein 1 [Rhinatrema bivittatum]
MEELPVKQELPEAEVTCTSEELSRSEKTTMPTSEEISKPEMSTREEVQRRQDLSEQLPPFSLYVGQLNLRYSQETLCEMLTEILASINVILQKQDIEIVKNQTTAYALVHLDSESTYQAVLKQLQDPSAWEQSLLEKLAMKGKTLIVEETKQRSCASREAAENENRNESSILQVFQRKIKRKTQVRAKTPTGMENRITAPMNSPVAWPAVILPGTQSDSAIHRHESRGQKQLFYGAVLGMETRNVEFKRGGGEYLSLTFKHHVRKYTCAFLNSEGGSLFVGIEDTGVITGIQCNHRDEDRVRLLVDSVVKGFRPPVFPQAYALSFIPVIKAGYDSLFLKVIQLTVHPHKQMGEPVLYDTDRGEVYIRRDGSIQGPLAGSTIQEWCRQKWTIEVRKLEGKVTGLLQENQQLQKQVEQQKESIEQMKQEQVTLLQQNQRQHNRRRLGSSICSIL